jgi:hypothetical protein
VSLNIQNFIFKEVKPNSDNNCICLIDADVEVDFAAPVDYVEKVLFFVLNNKIAP